MRLEVKTFRELILRKKVQNLSLSFVVQTTFNELKHLLS